MSLPEAVTPSRRIAIADPPEPLAPLDPFGPVHPNPLAPARPTVVPKSSNLVTALGNRYVEHIVLEPEDRRAIIASLFHEGSRSRPYLRRFGTLTALSVFIAVLGLMADSTAVVIGAMLVAPLMSPVLATAAAIVMGWPKRVRANLGLLGLGTFGALALAAAIGVFARGELDPIPNEVLARTAPNMLDLGIAAAAGASGAYAYVRKHASDALAGAAVAVALVPPISVTGLMLQLGEFNLAGGAALLFTVNVAGVLAAGAATFLIAGFAPGQRLLAEGSRIQDGLKWTAIAAVIVALPLQFSHQTLLPVPLAQEDVEAAVATWSDTHGEEVKTVGVGVDYVDGTATVDLVIVSPGAGAPVEQLADAIAQEADEPVSVNVQVIEAESATVDVEEPPTDQPPPPETAVPVRTDE
jgi:uncharacterized hydrophobic protein (TIGR00271 family)